MPTLGLSLVWEGLDRGARPSRKRPCKKTLTWSHTLALNKESEINSSLLIMDAFLPWSAVEQFTWAGCEMVRKASGLCF